MREVKVDAGQACRPARGEQVAGDDAVVVRGDGFAVAALADGLGHGPAAAAAAGELCRVVRADPDRPLLELLRTANRSLAGGRGAVVGLIRVDLDRSSLTYAGVGNISFVARAAVPMRPLSAPGIVGRLGGTVVRPFDFPVVAGDTVALHSDGVTRVAGLEAIEGLSAQRAAEDLLAAWGRDDDDASCVVLRIVEATPC